MYANGNENENGPERVINPCWPFVLVFCLSQTFNCSIGVQLNVQYLEYQAPERADGNDSTGDPLRRGEDQSSCAAAPVIRFWTYSKHSNSFNYTWVIKTHHHHDHHHDDHAHRVNDNPEWSLKRRFAAYISHNLKL